MNINEKIALFQRLNSRELLRVELFYDVLEKCGALKTNYVEFSTTHPVDCDTELLRLPIWNWLKSIPSLPNYLRG